MAIRQFELSADPEKVDPNQTRAESLKDQIKTAQENLELLGDDQKKSDRAFNLKQRIATLKMQLDRLNKRVSDNKEKEKKDAENKDKEESAEVKAKCPNCGCQLDSKGVCHSTSCEDSPDYNVLTQI